jgi:hypothetical protein
MRRDGRCCDGKPLARFPTPKEIIRFLEKVEVVDGHWIWTGARDGKGYGVFAFNGGTEQANRFSQQVFNRKLNKGEQANHADHCRNPSCVRPDCLGPLTVSENTADGNRNRKKKKVFNCPI